VFDAARRTAPEPGRVSRRTLVADARWANSRGGQVSMTGAQALRSGQ